MDENERKGIGEENKNYSEQTGFHNCLWTPSTVFVSVLTAINIPLGPLKLSIQP